MPTHPTFRSKMISGLVALVPLWITIVVLRAAFKAMGSFLTPFLAVLPWKLSPTSQFIASVIVFLLLIYLIGTFTTYLLGRRLLYLGEMLILKIPLVRSIYSAAKQIVDAISLSNRSAFKSVVLVEFPCEGVHSVGFITGTVREHGNREMLTVFMPTAPNPTTGFLLILPKEKTIPTGLSIESAIKMIVSGGVLSPQSLAQTQGVATNSEKISP